MEIVELIQFSSIVITKGTKHNEVIDCTQIEKKTKTNIAYVISHHRIDGKSNDCECSGQYWIIISAFG